MQQIKTWIFIDFFPCKLLLSLIFYKILDFFHTKHWNISKKYSKKSLTSKFAPLTDLARTIRAITTVAHRTGILFIYFSLLIVKYFTINHFSLHNFLWYMHTFVFSFTNFSTIITQFPFHYFLFIFYVSFIFGIFTQMYFVLFHSQ